MVQAPTTALEIRAKLFRGLSDRSRLTILEALRAGPHTVTELTEATRLSQSNASSHLSCLLECGLVTRTRQGKYALYALSDPRVAGLLGLADELLADVARGIYECTRFNPGAEE